MNSFGKFCYQARSTMVEYNVIHEDKVFSNLQQTDLIKRVVFAGAGLPSMWYVQWYAWHRTITHPLVDKILYPIIKQSQYLTISLWPVCKDIYILMFSDTYWMLMFQASVSNYKWTKKQHKISKLDQCTRQSTQKKAINLWQRISSCKFCFTLHL